MAGFLSVKMKRKDLEEVYDDFSDFSLSSPARKIRRLDAELPPIMEEEDPVMPQDLNPPLPEESIKGSIPQLAVEMTEAMPSLHLNEERALVLYKPVKTPLLESSGSSNLSFSVHTDLLQGFKNRYFWSGNSNLITEAAGEEATNDCQAIIPWVPSQLPVTQETDDSGMEIGLSEPMEAEEVGATTMEVEEDTMTGRQEVRESGGMGEGLQQWHQQHCMTTPQLPPNTSTPLMWSW
ncbi:uncharacterized protein LOC143879833 [Tasmannia lanceolata]|uniref:uncharacterized protein LOC143879833 n=1 Tax=Tasmannia lanceolata TaxID=3420 RepID=UPI0040632C4C